MIKVSSPWLPSGLYTSELMNQVLAGNAVPDCRVGLQSDANHVRFSVMAVDSATASKHLAVLLSASTELATESALLEGAGR